MSDRQNSYGRILKSSALLGGASMINVSLGILRTKVLAVYLGPAVLGIMGLYTSLATMIAGVASLGITQSAVREIAASAGMEDRAKIARSIRIVRRLVWVTGAMGVLAMLCIALPASWWTYGDFSHAIPIAGLALVVLFGHIQAGQTALLQGMRRIGDLGAVSVTGSVLSTLLAIPILLYFRENGITPFLIAAAAGQLAVSWLYARRVKVDPVPITWSQTFRESGEILRLGLTFMISGAAVSSTAYLVRLIVQRQLGEVEVGLYHSSFTISGIYVGFVLHAMSGDYYPRLTSVAEDASARGKLVNEQAEMATLLVVPGLVAALIFSEIVIWLLYSSRFAGATGVLRWHLLGIFFRVVSWPLAFILLARADRSAFLSSEFTAHGLHIGGAAALTYIFGLDGAGAAFALMYAVYVGLIFVVVQRRHEFKFSPGALRLIWQGAVLVLAAFAITTFLSGPVKYSIGGVCLLLALCYTGHGLYRCLGNTRVAALLSRFRKVRPTPVGQPHS